MVRHRNSSAERFKFSGTNGDPKIASRGLQFCWKARAIVERGRDV